MRFSLYMPYQAPLVDNNSLDGYYASEQDYIDALRAEEAANGMMIFNTMSTGGLQNDTYYGGFNNRNNESHHVEEKVAYAKADCSLYSPNGAMPETVDSMIDKFASQKEFLVMVNLDDTRIEPEFEEELLSWQDETKNILKYANKMGEEWLDKNIPRRELRLSFLNKSNKLVSFQLEKCEIEEKISNNRYLLYVNRMQILK